jgi:hypothetical protein
MMRWLGKISLFLVFLLLPELFPRLTESDFCSLVAWGNQVVTFGQKGQDGVEGQNGVKGRDSETLTIFADGSPLNLDLSGRQGSPGDNGANGEDARCDNQPVNVKYNLRGASGGQGGTGGNGGDGGNGGSLTIYALNRDYLKQIYVQALGGQGGIPGNGGSGGRGCQCLQPYWSIESCTGKPGSPDYACSTTEFRCFNGEDGQNGRSGRPGREGKLGSLTLINSNQPLAPDRLSASVSMAELKDRGFNLSKNVWENRTGTASLFAPGSIIADHYLELVERIENSVVLIWNAPQSFEPFGDRLVTLNLQGDHSVAITLPEDLWLETSILQRNNVTQLFVFNAIKAEEATKLETKGLSGTGLALELELVDTAQRSDLIATQFYLKYSVSTSREARFRRVYDYTLKYEGEVPPQFVRYSGNRFIIDIGQLSIDPKFLQADTAVEIRLEATRSFGNNSATQTIVVRDILGPFN